MNLYIGLWKWSNNWIGNKPTRRLHTLIHLGRIKTLPRRRVLLCNILKGSLQEVIILLILNPLPINLVPLNVLSVWERIILHPNVLTKGPWLCWRIERWIMSHLRVLIVPLVKGFAEKKNLVEEVLEFCCSFTATKFRAIILLFTEMLFSSI